MSLDFQSGGQYGVTWDCLEVKIRVRNSNFVEAWFRVWFHGANQWIS